MKTLEVILLAIGLSMDACAVCMAASASGLSQGARATFRLAFHFGLFQFLMPVIGWYLGNSVAPYITAFDHWVAFALLSFVGGRMIIEAFKKEVEEDDLIRDPSKGLSLVMLSVATSIDALAIGLSLAMLGTDIWYPAVIIGCITGTLSVAAVRLGSVLGKRFGDGMEIFGGIVLIGIGIKVVIEHM